MQTLQISNGDFVLNRNGRLNVVEGATKLAQITQEILTIDAMSNGFGASLNKTGLTVETEIYEAFNRLKLMQSNSTYTRDSSESFSSIQRLQVRNSGINTIFDLSVVSNSGETVNMTVGVKI